MSADPNAFQISYRLPPDTYLEEREYARFDSYARRVQYLPHTIEDLGARAIFLQLATLRPFHSSFPNLRRIYLQVNDQYEWPHALVLPSLQHIIFCDRAGVQQGDKFIRCLTVRAPLLRTISLSGDMPWSTLPFIAQFQELTCLDLINCTICPDAGPSTALRYHDFFHNLAAKPNLARLRLPKNLRAELFSECVGFPSLAELDMYEPPTAVTAFLRMLSPGTLRKAKLLPCFERGYLGDKSVFPVGHWLD